MRRVRTLILCLLCAICAHAQVDNYALHFTSDKGLVNLGVITQLKSTQNYTLQFWFCPDSWQQGAALLRCGKFSIKLGREHALVINDGTEHFAATSSAVAANTWTHLTLAVSADETTLLLNNSPVMSYPARLTLPCETSSIWLGGNYRGRIDEVRLWNSILPAEYSGYWRTTLNTTSPGWSRIVAYWKMDQEKCINLVDYRNRHHGTLSSTGVRKEKVTDNAKFKYLINLAYGNIERFFDRTIDSQHYWMANRISIIGATVNTDAGTASLYTTLDNGTLKDGAEHLDSYNKRTGVLSLPTADARMQIPASVINGADAYAIETWVYIDEWTEGAYIYRKENANGTSGLSIRLGNADDQQLIVRTNGQDLVYNGMTRAGRWTHLGISPNPSASSAKNAFMFEVSGTSKAPTTAPTSSVTTALPSLTTPATLGEGLIGKFDETIIWSKTRDVSAMAEDRNRLPMPGEDVQMQGTDYYYTKAMYCYDRPEEPGFDSYSVQGFFHKMRSYTKGMRGCKFTLTVAANNFENCLANATKRNNLAKDIAAMGNDDAFDGIDLDFEWTYSNSGWNNIGLLCEAIRPLLKDGKILSVSPHKVAYGYPTNRMWAVDYFNFQCYGPGDRDLCTRSGYTNASNLFVNHGYPREKIILSYSTTTTGGYRNGSRVGSNQPGYYPAGYRYIYDESTYDPDGETIYDKGADVTYWIAGYNQVVWRGQYVVENDLGGIMFWDLGNDLPYSHKHSLARASEVWVGSNVETLITEVNSAAPAPADDTTGPIDTPDPDDQGGQQKESEIITRLADLQNDMAYTLTNANGLGSICSTTSSDFVWLGNSSNSNFSQTISLDDISSQWLIINYDGQYYLYSLGRNQFVEVAAFDVTSQACFFTAEPKPVEVTVSAEGTFAFRTYITEERGYMCASPQLPLRPVCQWTLTDTGSQWTVATAPSTRVDAYLRKALIAIDPTTVGHISTSPVTPPATYDMQGRRTRPTTHGLYIHNGRKVIR